MLKMKFSQKMRLLLEKRTIYLPQTKSPKSSNISTDNVHTSAPFSMSELKSILVCFMLENKVNKLS